MNNYTNGYQESIDLSGTYCGNVECNGCVDGCPQDCQGCEACPDVPFGRPSHEIQKEDDEWRIAHLASVRPDESVDFWRGVVESGTFNWPEPTPPPPYAGFSQYVRQVVESTVELPALLSRSDGATIFYAGKVNSLFGEPGMCKSWVELKVALAALEKGGRVLYWDFEDRPDTLYRRAKALGKESLELITGPNVAFVDGNILELTDEGIPNPGLAAAVEWLAEAGIYSLVVIDAAESSGAPSDGSSVAGWFKQMVTPFSQRAMGVLILDHVPKRRQERPRGAIGSQHKLARIDGAAVGISGKPWTKTQDGVMVLRLEKDRQGDVPGNVGAKIATLKGIYEGELLTITIDPPNADDDEGDIPMKILTAIADAGPDGVRGTNTLKDMVKGKGQYKAQAIVELVQDGLIAISKDGKTNVHKLTDAGRIILEDEGV